MILLIGGPGFLYLLQLRDVPLRISKDTTLYTEPILENGQIDLVTAWDRTRDLPHLKSPKNGFRHLVEHIRFPEFPGEERQCWNEVLGLPEDHLATCEFVPLDIYLEDVWDTRKHDIQSWAIAVTPPDYWDNIDHDLEDFNTVTGALYRSYRNAWTPDDLPWLEQWLILNEKAIEQWEFAVECPYFEVPLHMTGAPQDFGIYDWINLQEIRLLRNQQSKRSSQHLRELHLLRRWGHQLGNVPVWAMNYAGNHALERANAYPILTASRRPSASDLNYLMQDCAQWGYRDPHPDLAEYVLLNQLYLLVNMLQGTDQEWRTNFDEEYPGAIDWNVVAMRIVHDSKGKDLNQLAQQQEMETEPPHWLDTWTRRRRSWRLGHEEFSRDAFAMATGAIKQKERLHCQSNLQRLAVAMLLYEKDHGHLPPAYTVDDAGNRLHSWRVLLLPYLGQESLYQQIRKDEPWNSAHNQSFASLDLPIFRCPSDPHVLPGETNYFVAVGYESLFQGSIGRRIADLPDDSEDWVLVMEQNHRTPWMSPEEEPSVGRAFNNFRWAGSFEPELSHHSNELNVGLRNGKTCRIFETQYWKFGALLTGSPMAE